MYQHRIHNESLQFLRNGKKRKVLIKVTYYNYIAITLCVSFHFTMNPIEIGLCAQFLAKLLSNIAIFH